MRISAVTRLTLRVLWIFGLVLVAVGSLLPPSSTPMQVLDRLHIPDKALHLTGYALLALLPAIHEPRRTLARFILVLIAVGAGLELAQFLSGRGRLFELLDIAANTGGILGGVAVGLVLRG